MRDSLTKPEAEVLFEYPVSASRYDGDHWSGPQRGQFSDQRIHRRADTRDTLQLSTIRCFLLLIDDKRTRCKRPSALAQKPSGMKWSSETHFPVLDTSWQRMPGASQTMWARLGRADRQRLTRATPLRLVNRSSDGEPKGLHSNQ